MSQGFCFCGETAQLGFCSDGYGFVMIVRSHSWSGFCQGSEIA